MTVTANLCEARDIRDALRRHHVAWSTRRTDEVERIADEAGFVIFSPASSGVFACCSESCGQRPCHPWGIAGAVFYAPRPLPHLDQASQRRLSAFKNGLRRVRV